MSEFKISESIDPLLRVTLGPNESVFAESNAMVAMQGNLTLKGRARGGLLQSLARKFLNSESLFEQKLQADENGGSALLAPNLPGALHVLEVGATQYKLSDGAFLAATENVSLSISRQSLGKALLANSGGLFVMATEGSGQVVVSGFGSIQELTVRDDQPLIVDNGHVVAWDASLHHELSLNTTLSGFLGKLFHSQTTGEGIVLKFRGEGKVLVCSRNKGGFLQWIFGHLPKNKMVNNES